MQKTDMYTINKGHSCHAGLRWVATALSTDKTRYVLTRIMIKEDVAVGTDGRRLHILTDPLLTQIEDGLYAVIKQNPHEVLLALDKDAGTFPNYKQVIPDTHSGSFNIGHNSKKGESVGRLIFELGKRNLARVDSVYADDMFSFNPDGMTVHVTDKLNAVTFTSKGRLGALMPLREGS